MWVLFNDVKFDIVPRPFSPALPLWRNNPGNEFAVPSTQTLCATLEESFKDYL